MAADLINLRQARKARARADKDALAARNRADFGRTKAERTRSDAAAELARRRHEAHRLFDDTPDDTPDEPQQ